MLILYGTAATSQNKQKSLLHDAQRICGKITGVDVSYIHFVKCRTVSSEQLLKQQDTLESRILSSLLNYGSHGTQRHPDTTGRSTFYVVPRSGTVSPWSSKATDIAHTCNLKKHIERIERGTMYTFATEGNSATIQEELVSILQLIHDRMTQTVLMSLPDESILFQKHDPRPLRVVLLEDGERDASGSLSSANKEFGLALSTDEVNYLAQAFSSRDKAHNPTDAELFMFAQVNSEHCRHKIFNASWVINGTQQDFSLFEMIRFTEQQAAHKAVSAYSDNAAVMDGFEALQFYPEVRQHEDGTLSHSIYTCQKEQMPILVKVETHNHPTAISPFPGAATGSGGEIRDEGSVGQGSRPKAGLSGFCVSNLLIPDYIQPWETNFGQPAHVASALDIMLDGPLGSSSYNNEFGRPGLIGFFRTFAERVPARQNDKYEVKGYHKPIMIAGGLGHVRPQFAKKKKIKPGSALIVLGGPGLLIGLGGGAASSLASGSVSADLDFASVQRDNAEMQRRCQQVINTCIEQVDQNPIESIHDVGAGGLSNALPELVHDSDLGAIIEIRDILVDDSSMSPMEIWCNESQERYVLAVSIEMMKSFEWIAQRERCPFSVVGHVTAEKNLLVTDRLMGKDVVDLEMSTLFGKPPRMIRHDHKVESTFIPFDSTLSSYLPYIDSMKRRLSEAVDRILHLPTVGSKSFLITIGDRSVTGLVTRDQMVGPWQVPVADVAVTRSSYGFDCLTGEAMAMGERPIVALINPAASARMALAESLTNLSSAAINGLDSVKLSANWMADASKPGEGASLYEAVHAVAVEACPQLGVSIPVGKDSMSMSMKWKRGKEEHSVSSPLSLIISAFAPVENITSTWTPHIRTDLDTDTLLLFIDLALGKKRLGGSALSQVFKQIGSEAPDVEDFAHLHSFLMGCQKIHSNHQSLILAYHDRSDGGLFTTLAEMSFAGRAGLEIDLDVIDVSRNPLATLFNEELGVVVQVRAEDSGYIRTIFSEFGFPTEHIHTIGHVNQDRKNQELVIFSGGDILFSRSRILLQQAWSETSFRMQSLRDNADCAKKEFELISSDGDGIRYELTFQYEALQKYITRPKVAILREQGVNGHVEMAWAFNAAGFEAVDVHMTDIIEGHVTLQDFRGLAACGGFSYGDVLGAGKGWANSILWNSIARKEFAQFFSRTDVFSLAVCNGCQLFSHLRSLIPGTELWPDFTSNLSERFEARVSMVEIVSGPVTSTSVFLRDMQGSRLPVAIAHGEGRAWFHDLNQQKDILKHNLVAVRYVDWDGKPTEYYPLNPNGSPEGYTGIQTPDGRVLALMPHPERVTTLDSNSWYPPSMSSEWRGTGPWFRIFQNARKWCG